MTTETEHDMHDLGPVARQVAGLLDGVSEEHLDAPTPCPAYRVRDLLGHLLELTQAFTASGRKELGPLTDTSPDDPAAVKPSLDGDWRGRLRRQLDDLVEVWRAPEAWEGTTRAGGVTLPGPIAGQVALNELLVHGWDLSRATGQPFTADDASVQVSIGLLSQALGDDAREGTGFGSVVPVPDDASPLDRAVGLSGRSPEWTPPGGSGGPTG
ncbi:TIGR03086 family metal-binding protein [Streptomyces sp. URMC 129]|uniref:TIGR03086 family metal-binding protein n=1 Tax=Streptomyces sp. URMC 129 TaxID=3423407 RepID=UPI003F1B46B0